MVSSAYNSQGQSFDDDGVFYSHPGETLTEVMKDTCQRYPEDPFCFLNERSLHERGQFLIENFGRESVHNNFTVAYAVKANARKRILQVLAGAGIKDFDCASPNEMKDVLAVNPDARILYNHPVKRQKDIEAARAMGVSHFTIQSRAELEKILTHSQNKPLELVVRMETPNEDAVIDLSTKFGASREEAENLLDRLDGLPNVTGGLGVHTGSQNKNPRTFRNAISQIAEVAKAHKNIHIINLGGGIPVNYFPKDKYEVSEYITAINMAIKELLGDGYEIIIELGRSIIAEAVDLVIPVTSVEKRSGERCAYIFNGLFTSFSDSVVHPGWKYNFQPYSPRGKKFSEEKVPFTIFGRTCDSGDVIHNVDLPVNIETDDYLWVAEAGAYLDCQGTLFNGFGLPEYISYNTLT